jgi:hypothetical protein
MISKVSNSSSIRLAALVSSFFSSAVRRVIVFPSTCNGYNVDANVLTVAPHCRLCLMSFIIGLFSVFPRFR